MFHDSWSAVVIIGYLMLRTTKRFSINGFLKEIDLRRNTLSVNVSLVEIGLLWQASSAPGHG